ncbi:MAG: hypothetical protein IH971_04375 [Candidatus Marinimicrobia bacterium]|nr:hypothetical protein [Candidatus Neomarinimicrobiota bacterium]
MQATFAVAAVALLGACDFQLPTKFELPRWDVSLTLPLINRTYSLETLADNDTTISQDTTTKEIQIEFTGALDTTRIDSSLLEIALPASATSQTISQTVDGVNASDFFSPVEESFQIVIALDSILRAANLPAFDAVSFPSPFDVPIPQDDWNNWVASEAISQSAGPVQIIDTATAFQSISFIERMRYLRLGSTSFSSKFVTSIENDGFPTSIDSVDLSMASGSLLSVSHQSNSVLKNTTYADSTDLASARLGADISFGVSMQFPQAGADVIISAGDSAKIIIDIVVSVGTVDSLAVTTAQTSVLQDPPNPVELPGEVAILSGVLRSGVVSPINEVALTGLSNTLPFDLLFSLTFPNFASTAQLSDSLTFGPFVLSDGDAPVNDTKMLGGFTFHNPAGSGAIDAFEFIVLAEVVAADIAIPLDGSALGTFQLGIEFGDAAPADGQGDLHFASIEGNFQISFPAVSTTIENIPAGFVGFKFGRISLSMLLRNQIDLPVELDLRLVGRSLEGDSVSVPIKAPINYPSKPNAPSDNGDTTSTLIILDGTSVRTYWLPEGETHPSMAWDSVISPNSDGSIVDVLNLPPDIIEVGGAATVRGQGVVEAGKGIWGEFGLIAPFAFIIPQDISFLPTEPTPLEPMDEATREQIKTALISATLTSRVTTNFPLGGKISMLASDSTLFPLALDFLDDLAAEIPTMARTGDSTIYSTISAVLAADSILNVNEIVFYPESPVAGATLDPVETVAKRVEFISTLGDTFWVGRLFDMELPPPKAVNELGWVTTPGDTTQVIALDAERVGWLASDSRVFLKTFITLYGTDGVRTIRSTDWIQFSAFIGFNLTSDIFSIEEADTAVVGVTTQNDTSVAVDGIVVIDLGAIFSNPDDPAFDITDPGLGLSATSSHTGVASVGRIYFFEDDSLEIKTKLLEVHGDTLGTARITVMLDDQKTAPVSTSFLVKVTAAPMGRVAVRPASRGKPGPVEKRRWGAKAERVRK